MIKSIALTALLTLTPVAQAAWEVNRHNFMLAKGHAADTYIGHSACGGKALIGLYDKNYTSENVGQTIKVKIRVDMFPLWDATLDILDDNLHFGGFFSAPSEITKQMIQGDIFRVRYPTATKGKFKYETYPLKGFTAAYRQHMKACAPSNKPKPKKELSVTDYFASVSLTF
jgi:hypothetical protein